MVKAETRIPDGTLWPEDFLLQSVFGHWCGKCGKSNLKFNITQFNELQIYILIFTQINS